MKNPVTRKEFDKLIEDMKTLGKPTTMSYEAWVSNGCPDSERLCRLIYGCSYNQLRTRLSQEKLEAAKASPFRKTEGGAVDPAIRRRLFRGIEQRVRLDKMGELTAGLEIPFIKLWDSLPNKTTTIKEMSEIFVNAAKDKRLATAKNMIRRAVDRGDATILE